MRTDSLFKWLHAGFHYLKGDSNPGDDVLGGSSPFPGGAARQGAGALTDQGSGETVTMGGVDFERAQRADARTIQRLGAELLWSF